MTYPMTVAGLRRDLPICKVTDDLYIGAFIVFGDAENLNSPWDNVTLVSTGIDNPAVPGYASKTGNTAVTDYRGLGHSSNVVGPNLDSIYTAYHNAGRINYRNENDNTGGTRKFNVTQYFTNEGYLLTNGLGNYTRTKPEMPDYSASASALSDGKSTESSGNVFTAEISFRLTDGAAEVVAGGSTIAIDGANLTVKKGSESLAHGTVPTSTNPDAIHTVKVINGASKAEIYFDNVLAAKPPFRSARARSVTARAREARVLCSQTTLSERPTSTR